MYNAQEVLTASIYSTLVSNIQGCVLGFVKEKTKQKENMLLEEKKEFGKKSTSFQAKMTHAYLFFIVT